MRQRDELAIKLEDLEMESDVLTAEKEVLEEDFNEASDRLEAVQVACAPRACCVSELHILSSALFFSIYFMT